MAGDMRWPPTAQLQPEGIEKPVIYPSVPWQEEQSDAKKGKIVADYNLDVDYTGSEPKNELVTQEEKEENSDTVYMNMKIPCNGLEYYTHSLNSS